MVTTRLQSRIEWLDYAKGICIFLVVMLHATDYVHSMYGLPFNQAQHGWLDYVADFAKPFRMPDFFLLSGLLLSRVIDRPWRRYLDTKVAHFMYFYVLWFVVLYLFINVRHSWGSGWQDADQLLPEFFLHLLGGSLFPLWFIHSLPIYFVVTKLLRKVPPWLVLGVLATLHSLVVSDRIFSMEEGGPFFLNQFCLRYIFFYTGYLAANYVFSMASWASANRSWAILSLLVWAILEQWAVSSPGLSELPLISLVMGYSGALAVIFVASLLSKLPFVSWLHYLGKNSIIVYLGFFAPMIVLTRLVHGRIADASTAAFVVTVLSVAASVVGYLMLKNTPLKFFYVRPEWARISQPAAAQTALATKQ